MEWIPQVLQLPVIVDRGRFLSSQLQRLQKLDFVFSGIAAQRSILEELFKPWFQGDRLLRVLFGKLKSLPAACREPAVQNNFHTKGFEVDIPGVDHRIQEGDAVFNRDVKNVRVQELEK